MEKLPESTNSTGSPIPMPANQSTPEVTFDIRRNPESIWLSPICDDTADHGDGRTWASPAPEEVCEDPECGEPWVRYVREDLASPARGGDELRATAQFLSDRLDDLEWMDGDLESTLRDFMGHVDPAHARLKSALASTDMAGAAASEPISSHPENGAAPPVEGLTSGEGDVERLQQENAAYLSDVRWWLEIATGKGHGSITDALNAAPSAASPKATATASVREPWPGYAADMERRRVVTLAKVGQMLSIMAGGEVPEVEGYDASDLYAEVLLSLGVEDVEFPDLALQGVEDDPDAYFLTDSGTAATIGGERA